MTLMRAPLVVPGCFLLAKQCTLCLLFSHTGDAQDAGAAGLSDAVDWQFSLQDFCALPQVRC